jgi:hypothetical protein
MAVAMVIAVLWLKMPQANKTINTIRFKSRFERVITGDISFAWTCAV